MKAGLNLIPKYWLAIGFFLHVAHALQAQRTYRLSPGTEVKISGTSTLSDWSVTGKDLTGDLVFTAQRTGNKTSQPPVGRITRAEALLNVSNIHGERGEAMDNKMYNALKREEHPTIRFVLQKPIELTNWNGSKHALTATGELSMAGRTKEFSCEMKLSCDNNTWTFTGEKSMKLSDFEITPPSAMFGQIVTGDEIRIAFLLIYEPQEAH